ncbi:hypothetical protein WNY78_08235 [Psychroserpens sp. AS72]|uniref:hypothetical protein n=1 Tax=Psychroserpens sp. AS72 TaxID=3135775 RepID=UPI0031757DB6
MKNLKLRLTILTLVIFTSFNYSALSQVGIGTEPDDSAMLDISSTEKGLLTPRMTSAQKVAISSPAVGLIVFDTDESAFYFYDGSNWKKLVDDNSSNDYTGWADYIDGTYTSVSPLLLIANTKVILPNDANTIRDSQKPVDIASFYDPTTSKIIGRDGDGLNIMIEFKVRPTANTDTKITVTIDIGSPVGEIYTRDFITSKGVGVEHFYLSSFNAYTLNTWATNGGIVKIESDYPADVYDIRYVFTRTHKAR